MLIPDRSHCSSAEALLQPELTGQIVHGPDIHNPLPALPRGILMGT